MCLCEYVMCVGAHKGWKTWKCSCLMWVLGTDLRSSGRAEARLSCWPTCSVYGVLKKHCLLYQLRGFQLTLGDLKYMQKKYTGDASCVLRSYFLDCLQTKTREVPTLDPMRISPLVTGQCEDTVDWRNLSTWNLSPLQTTFCAPDTQGSLAKQHHLPLLS